MELKELGLPDRVLTMGWCGDSICLGFHRECASFLHLCSRPDQAFRVMSVAVKPYDMPQALCSLAGRESEEQLREGRGCAGTTWCM